MHYCSCPHMLCTPGSGSDGTIHEVWWVLWDFFQPWKSYICWSNSCPPTTQASQSCGQFYVLLLASWQYLIFFNSLEQFLCIPLFQYLVQYLRIIYTCVLWYAIEIWNLKYQKSELAITLFLKMMIMKMVIYVINLEAIAILLPHKSFLSERRLKSKN